MNASSPSPGAKKGRITYLPSGSKDEDQIRLEFNRIYAVENEPEGMALCSNYVDGLLALSITPNSVPYCASLFTIVEWCEYNSIVPFGAVNWEAGDQRLRNLASTIIVPM